MDESDRLMTSTIFTATVWFGAMIWYVGDFSVSSVSIISMVAAIIGVACYLITGCVSLHRRTNAGGE